jgi:Type I phosphodiesterase / nucleotide pyrophosphatase
MGEIVLPSFPHYSITSTSVKLFLMDICRRTFGAALVSFLGAPGLAAISRPKLLVLVVLEQLSADCLNQLLPALNPGGFRKLLDRGAHFPDCRHAASTFSATCVATLATGAWPSQHGIVADYWFDRASKRVVPASDEALAATTLAAQVLAESGARVHVIADSGAHARMFAGSPDANIFWMDSAGQFFARGDAPEWLAEFNTGTSPENLHNMKWMALGAKPDAPPLRTLTYDQNHPGEFRALYRSSYFAQAAPFDLLRECITREQLGQTGGIDFVCVLSSASALLGYETGARSPLMQQMVLQLDRQIETLLTDLGHAVGESGFAIAIVGGHGAPPEPPLESRARMAVGGEALAKHVAASLAANKLGAPEKPVEKYVYPFLYLAPDGVRDLEALRLAAARAAFEYPAVANYYTAGGACSATGLWRRRFRNSFHMKRSGDAMLSYRPEYIEDSGLGRGVSYGSLYDYDVQVPLFFYGPQFRAGIYESPVESVDVAPTLARAMGVAAPSSSVGRVLGEAVLE